MHAFSSNKLQLFSYTILEDYQQQRTNQQQQRTDYHQQRTNQQQQHTNHHQQHTNHHHKRTNHHHQRTNHHQERTNHHHQRTNPGKDATASSPKFLLARAGGPPCSLACRKGSRDVAWCARGGGGGGSSGDGPSWLPPRLRCQVVIIGLVSGPWVSAGTAPTHSEYFRSVPDHAESLRLQRTLF